MFVEKTEVEYRGMFGIIDFICDRYVVIKLSARPGLNSARILVFTENYREISILKESQK